VLFAWLQHTDIKPQNSIDMYYEDQSGSRYLMHYWLDFGLSLGAFGHGRAWQWDGYSHTLDWDLSLKALFSLGLWKAPWEDTVTPQFPDVGHFSADHFHIDDYRAIYPFLPHERADRFDHFWAAKIVMRFTPELIRTAVEQGGYTSEESVNYLTETLIERQQHIGRVWLNRVAPLDELTADARGLCAHDLLIRYGLQEFDAATQFSVTAYDANASDLGWSSRIEQAPAEGSLVCLELPPVNAYTIVEIRMRRPNLDVEPPPLWVHLAPDGVEGSKPRIVGLWRE